MKTTKDPDTKVIKAVCPLCGEDVQLPERFKACQVVYCSSCDSELEILTTDPPTLDWPYIQGHDTYLGDGDRQSPWNIRH